MRGRRWQPTPTASGGVRCAERRAGSLSPSHPLPLHRGPDPGPPPPPQSGGARVACAAAAGGGKTVEGISPGSGGRLTIVAMAGARAVGGAWGTLAGLDSPAINDRGDVAFLATVRRGRETTEAV